MEGKNSGWQKVGMAKMKIILDALDAYFFKRWFREEEFPNPPPGGLRAVNSLVCSELA